MSAGATPARYKWPDDGRAGRANDGVMDHAQTEGIGVISFLRRALVHLCSSLLLFFFFFFCCSQFFKLFFYGEVIRWAWEWARFVTPVTKMAWQVFVLNKQTENGIGKQD